MADLLHLPLSGRVLVEASAGTGKTHALELLFTRLVALDGVPVEAILVVTFTEAATAELRTRLARRLERCRRALADAGATDPLAQALRQARQAGAPVAGRLETALQAMDHAAISTIHGFCRRLLARFAPAALGELTPDLGPVIHQVAMDFWRQHLAPLPGPAGQALRARLAVDDLEAVLALPALAQGPRIHPPVPALDPAPLAAAEEALASALAAVRAAWPGIAAAAAWCAAHRQECLHGGRIRPGTLERALAAWERFLNAPWQAPAPEMAKLVPSFLQAQRKKNATATPDLGPLAPLETAWQAAGEFQKAVAAFRVAALAHLAATATDRLDAACQQAGVHGFDALLRHAARLLEDPAVRRQAQDLWQVALVDEFQDTDALQERILSHIFDAPGHARILVGDPKQSIYAFRGADLPVYLTAARTCGHRATLGTNYRAAPALVAAVNAIFGRHPQTFVLPELDFTPVQPRPAPWPTLTDPDLDAACVLWRVPAPERPLAKEAAVRRVAQAVAAEASRLLRAGAKVDGAPLHPGHLAVLVDTHAQMGPVAAALEAAGIPCVLEEEASVLESAEAHEVLALLLALREPRRRTRVATALATGLMGLDAAALHALTEDAEALGRWQEVFARGQDTWQRHGVVAAVEELLQAAGARQRLLAWTQGLRAVTNLDHVLELLQTWEMDGAGPAALCRLLARPAPHQAAALRPVHGAETVRILTVHKSKGLEFPVVFCPFPWRATAVALPLAYHEDDELVLDFRGDPSALERAHKEALAEGVRLAYVALTRASHRLYLAWGRVRGADTAGLAWVLHGHRGPVDWQGLDEAAVDADLTPLADAVAIQPLPTEPPQPWTPPQPAWELRLAPWTRQVAPPPAIQSFTSLTRGRGSDAPGLDEEPAVPTTSDPAPGEALDLAGFPRGPLAGSCLHALWQAVAAGAAPAEAAQRCLADFGLSPSWSEALTAMVDRVLDADLGGGLRLRQATGWSAELEFLLPTAGLTAAELAALCQALAGRRPALAQDMAPGWITGFVDAVVELEGRFYVVDWKTHHLGPDPAAYTPAAMAAVMAGSSYDLQAALYLAALARLLAWRLPGTPPLARLGGAFFLFVRGIHPQYPGHGIVHVPASAPTMTRLLHRLCLPPQR